MPSSNTIRVTTNIKLTYCYIYIYIKLSIQRTIEYPDYQSKVDHYKK